MFKLTYAHCLRYIFDGGKTLDDAYEFRTVEAQLFRFRDGDGFQLQADGLAVWGETKEEVISLAKYELMRMSRDAAVITHRMGRCVK